jgi:hypothetical protein
MAARAALRARRTHFTAPRGARRGVIWTLRSRRCAVVARGYRALPARTFRHAAMRPLAVRLLAAAALAGAFAASAAASEASLAAWQAAQRADSAERVLSERYAAIWVTLDAAQKARFSAQERAWLNEGRQQEQQACLQAAGARTDLAVSTCAAEVTERHVGALATTPRVAAAR